MSDRERAMQLLESLPDNKIAYVIGYIQGLAVDRGEAEETEPDEWDLAMIKEAEKENDGHGIPIENLAAELGITLKQNCDNEMYLVCNGVPQDCDLGEYRELGNHSIIINEDNLQYDLNIIGFPDNRITFIIFDNKQKSIVEYRYFFYDNISEEWILEREDYGMQAIWNKR